MLSKRYHLKLRENIQKLNLENFGHQDVVSVLDAVNQTYEAYENEVNFTKTILGKSYKKLAL